MEQCYALGQECLRYVLHPILFAAVCCRSSCELTVGRIADKRCCSLFLFAACITAVLAIPCERSFMVTPSHTPSSALL